jgi:hypothetical protein
LTLAETHPQHLPVTTSERWEQAASSIRHCTKQLVFLYASVLSIVIGKLVLFSFDDERREEEKIFVTAVFFAMMAELEKKDSDSSKCEIRTLESGSGQWSSVVIMHHASRPILNFEFQLFVPCLSKVVVITKISMMLHHGLHLRTV